MADEQQNIVQALMDALKNSAGNLDEFKKRVTDLAGPNGLIGLATASSKVTTALQATGTAASKSLETIRAFMAGAPAAMKAMGNFISDNSKSFKELGGNLLYMDTITTKFSESLLGASQSIGVFANSAGKGADSSEKFTNILKTIAGYAKGTGAGFLAEVFGNLNTQWQQASGIENKFREISMMGGNFTKTLGEAQKLGAKGVDQALTNRIQVMSAEAIKIGMSMKDYLELNLEIVGRLPGEADKAFNLIDNKGKSISLSTTQLISTIARGAGVATEKATAFTDDLLGKFGTNTKNAVTQFSLLAKTAQDLGLPFDKLQEAAMSINNEFGMWGSQVNSVNKLVTQMSTSLKDSGVGWKNQIELARNLSSSISKMSMPKLAYLGMQGGGMTGGGLGAGLQMEQKLQEGKMGEVVSMLQNVLKQRTGGQVITLQQANESPAMQREFMVQREFLKSFTGFDDAAANRMLQAMSKADLGGVSSQAEAQNAMKDIMSEGKSQQDKQTDYSQQIVANTAEANSLLAAIAGGELARKTIKTGVTADEAYRKMGGNKLDIERAAAGGNLTVMSRGKDAKEEMVRNASAGATAAGGVVADVMSNAIERLKATKNDILKKIQTSTLDDKAKKLAETNINELNKTIGELESGAKLAISTAKKYLIGVSETEENVPKPTGTKGSETRTALPTATAEDRERREKTQIVVPRQVLQEGTITAANKEEVDVIIKIEDSKGAYQVLKVSKELARGLQHSANATGATVQGTY